MKMPLSLLSSFSFCFALILSLSFCLWSPSAPPLSLIPLSWRWSSYHVVVASSSCDAHLWADEIRLHTHTNQSEWQNSLDYENNWMEKHLRSWRLQQASPVDLHLIQLLVKKSNWDVKEISVLIFVADYFLICGKCQIELILILSH